MSLYITVIIYNFIVISEKTKGAIVCCREAISSIPSREDGLWFALSPEFLKLHIPAIEACSDLRKRETGDTS